MKQIVCNTKFRLNAFGDGGSKRSVQLRELLSDNGVPYKEDRFELPKGCSNWQLFKLALRSVGFIRKNYPKKKIHSPRQYFDLIRYYALRLGVVYDQYEKEDVAFFWENTTDQKLVYLMKATGHTIVGVPHNLESLVTGRSVSALKDEIDNLKVCDLVFSISTEETWLLFSYK